MNNVKEAALAKLRTHVEKAWQANAGLMDPINPTCEAIRNGIDEVCPISDAELTDVKITPAEAGQYDCELIFSKHSDDRGLPFRFKLNRVAVST